MKLRVPLTDSERKLLKKIVLFSFCGCAALVLLVWVVRYLQVKRIAADSALSPTGLLAGAFSEKGLSPIDIEAHEFAAGYYLKIDQPARALPHLQRIFPLRKGDRKFTLDCATTYMEAGEYQKAAVLLNGLDETKITDTLSAAVAACYGLALFHLGRTEESIGRLMQCLEKNPSSAEAACYLGEVYAALSVPSDSAEKYFDRALRTDPLYTEGLYQAARYFMNAGDMVRARLYLSRILEKEPLHIRAHSRLGMVYYYLNEPQLAKKSYETALALNPGDYNTHYNLGELYYTAYDDKNAALREFKEALKIKPDHSEANFKTALICFSNNMIKEAARYLEATRAAAPTNTRFLLQLGVAYEQLGRIDDALEVYRRIKELDGLNRIAMQKIRMLSGSRQ
jgi:tetratricopeptide (TPR) repeat protein